MQPRVKLHSIPFLALPSVVPVSYLRLTEKKPGTRTSIVPDFDHFHFNLDSRISEPSLDFRHRSKPFSGMGGRFM